MKKDLIIGCYTGYDWNKIKFWVNSIEKSGFTGDKAMIVYNSDYDTVQKLIDRNFIIYAFNKDDVFSRVYYDRMKNHVVVQRFIDLYNAYSAMNMNQYRFVITTDVKDVIFQQNPSEWLDNYCGIYNGDIFASSESIHYKNEPWGNDNLWNSFLEAYDVMKDNIIYNCGIQAGIPNVMKDLWLNIYLLSKNNQIHNSDQAAYNLLLNSEPYKNITSFINGEDSWAAQLGTTMDPQKINDYRPHLLDKEPIISNGLVCTANGEPYYIVHQYDRIPHLKEEIEKKYAN